MKKCLKSFFAAVFVAGLLVSANAAIDIPGRTNTYINDYANILSPSDKARIETAIGGIRQKTSDKVELIVATFNNAGGMDPGDFAKAYAEKWRISKSGRDNGVVMVMLMQEGYFDIGVGKNLKNVLSDKLVKDILHTSILPYLDRGDFSGGLASGALRIIDILNASDIPSGKGIPFGRLFVVTAVIIIGLMVIVRFRPSGI